MGDGFALRGYVVERPLGRGSSGEVWRARAAASGAPVALKRILTADDAQRERACTEAALLRTLDHPNLIRLHAVVPTPDAVVLVLDLADGGSLDELLQARGRLTAGEVITAIAPVAAALAYLHEAGVVHGDVSPGNVLFTAAGMPLLADVGVARLVGADDAVLATPAYVDPTVAAGHLPGPPSDVFMLAGVALHALTGAPPWPGDPEAALSTAARGALGDVAARLAVADVPPAMAEVLLRALELDPARRGRAAELALDLRHSGRPVAVELAAGEARSPVGWNGPRHAARPGSPGSAWSGGADGGAGGVGGGADRGAGGGAGGDAGGGAGGARGGDGDADPVARPSFARPREVPDAEPPTRMVGPRPRPVIPRPPGRRPRRRMLVAAAAMVTAVLAAGGIGWAATRPAGPESERPRAKVETLAGPSGLRGTPSSPPSGAQSAGAQSAGAQSAGAQSAGRSADGRWLATLDGLDAVRARAFAAGDDKMLRSVYASAELAATDSALLHRLVPSGCGLRGVRTLYRPITVTPYAERATMIVTATLGPSQLVCGAQVRATLPGAGPTRLRIVVVRAGSGWRIAQQRVASG